MQLHLSIAALLALLGLLAILFATAVEVQA